MLRAAFCLAAALVVLPWQISLSAEIENPGARYDLLQVQLQRYRDIAAAGGWPLLPDGPAIQPGSVDPRLPLLARRLAVTGDLSGVGALTAPASYDAVLQDAVRRFQVRHGLEADGLVGRRTLQALNVPADKRVDQIRLNLERLRRIFDREEDCFILVNVAGFEAHVVRAGRIVWTTKVIVGETRDQTPIFNSVLTHIVFNPSWSVPHSIASEEMLPKINRDPEYFEKGSYELFDRAGNEVAPSSVDWSAVTTRSFPYRVVQRPGPWNELGLVKFIFPNEYSVCMHDTPGKTLFGRARRSFSHGCIRIAEPLRLAEVLLLDEGWTKEDIKAQVDSRETNTVVLSKSLPVLVFYWTAEVDGKGVMRFYEDIYERDARVFEALDALP